MIIFFRSHNFVNADLVWFSLFAVFSVIFTLIYCCFKFKFDVYLPFNLVRERELLQNFQLCGAGSVGGDHTPPAQLSFVLLDSGLIT